MPDLKNFYLDEVAPELMKEFGLRNVMQAPRVSKVVLNIGLGEHHASLGQRVDVGSREISPVEADVREAKI